MIGNFARKSSRNFVPILGIALVMGLFGCGGDDEKPASTATTPTDTGPKAVELTATGAKPGSPKRKGHKKTETAPSGSPEDQPGGAGDAEPARTLALFTGEDGRIRPRVVRVPAFISIQVELRSKDGRSYGLRFGNSVLHVSEGLSSISTSMDGLRPGKALIGTPTGAGNRVRIEATAEPGP
jgi:hypothetical protein